MALCGLLVGLCCFAAGQEYLNHPYYKVTVIDLKWINTSSILPSSLSNNDDGLVPVNPGFPILFYDHQHNDLSISPNGFIGFDIDTACQGYGFCLWDPTSPYYRYIAPFMTDFNPKSSDKSTVTFTTVDSDFVVTWEKVFLWGQETQDESLSFTFQVVLKPNGDFVFSYLDIPFDPSVIYSNTYDQHYPLQIGVGDAIFYEDKSGYDVSIPYETMQIPYETIAGGGVSIYLESLEGCARHKDCLSCIEFALEESTRLDCGWCIEDEICSTGVGREIEEGLTGCTTPESLEREKLECPLSPLNQQTNKVLGIVFAVTLSVMLISLLSCFIYKNYLKKPKITMGGTTDAVLPPPSNVPL
eukprot:Lithocolla_globosa_v1_NODE_191_length_5320_cov_8.118139.p2 type:complete len:357 gc:universal NODE_191_length_5320_cov_8.118139:4133-5203(+)